MVEVKPENMGVGKRIKTIRIAMGMDLAELGSKVNPPASASLASRWERGVNLPNNKRLQSIAELGNVTVDYLLNGLPVAEDKELATEARTKLDGSPSEALAAMVDRRLKHISDYNQANLETLLAMIDLVATLEVQGADLASLYVKNVASDIATCLSDNSTAADMKELTYDFTKLLGALES